jgi:indole-3-glycerol phosphate synthase
MRDVLRELVRNARELVASGYYDAVEGSTRAEPAPSLVRALRRHPTFPIIAEVKLASPGRPSLSLHPPKDLVRCYREGGAAALSVLTEPNHFQGSLEHLRLARGAGLPLLMKDIVVSESQIEAGARLGASAVLLIERVNRFKSLDADFDALIEKAHRVGVEVLLEVSDDEEMRCATRRGVDLIGINQRDLTTLDVDGTKGEALLREFRMRTDLPIIIMSGVSEARQLEAVRDLGADGALVGTALSSSPDPLGRLRGLAVGR